MLGSPPTPELLARARAGDAASLQQLLERYHSRLLERIRLVLGESARREADSVDFVQELCAELMAAPERLRGDDERAFLRWATAVARNNLRDQQRRRREISLAQLSTRIFQKRNGEPTSTPLERILEEESIELLTESLEALPEEAREIIVLRDLDGLDLQALATRLGCSPDAARMRHLRARMALGARLRQLLRDA